MIAFMLFCRLSALAPLQACLSLRGISHRLSLSHFPFRRPSTKATEAIELTFHLLLAATGEYAYMKMICMIDDY